jgi:hypothetical protein
MLPVKPGEQLISADIFGHQIERNTDYLGGQYSEYIGYDNEYYTGNKPPPVFVKEFIEVCEVFHVMVIRRSGQLAPRKAQK